MDYIKDILGILFVIFWFIVVTKIFRIVAAYIGEQLGFGKFFINLLEKIKR